MFDHDHYSIGDDELTEEFDALLVEEMHADWRELREKYGDLPEFRSIVEADIRAEMLRRRGLSN